MCVCVCSHDAVHARVIMKWDGLAWFDQEQTDDKVWALIHFHTGSWGVSNVGLVVPLLLSHVSSDVEISSY